MNLNFKQIDHCVKKSIVCSLEKKVREILLVHPITNTNESLDFTKIVQKEMRVNFQCSVRLQRKFSGAIFGIFS